MLLFTDEGIAHFEKVFCIKKEVHNFIYRKRKFFYTHIIYIYKFSRKTSENCLRHFYIYNKNGMKQ